MNFNLKVGIGSFLCGMVLAVCAVDLDLNGSWAFRFEEGRALEDVAKADFEATGTMPVPTCFDMTPQCLCKRGTALYRRTFALDHPVENAWLIIDGMSMRGSFAVDGRSLGVYPYPYAQLELETGPLAVGEHEIFAALDNRFDWQTREMVRASLNHPCVIISGFLNEFKSHTKEGRALAERLVKAVRAEDSGHLITWANNRRNADDICSDLMDIISINTYPGWIDASFAGGNAALVANIKNGPTGIDSIVARHRAKGRQQPIIVSEMGTCGIAFWQLTDARSYHSAYVMGAAAVAAGCMSASSAIRGIGNGAGAPVFFI